MPECCLSRLSLLRPSSRLQAALLAVCALVAVPAAIAQPAASAATAAPLPSTALPPSVEAALARAKVPRDAVTFFVADAEGRQPPRLAWRAQELVNPASVMKLVTTYAALDLLGPAYTWSTPVYADGAVVDGTLQGNLYLRGQGDPTMVVERLWLLLRRVQALGIRRIAGDVVVDRSAFDAGVESDPAAFDGEPLRPYNASPDAFLVNFRSVTLDFTPEAGGRFAVVSAEPPLAGVSFPARVPLSTGECGDWRTAL
ncbi:MAG: D-alanyl-D-alanine carboxypeptidase, partial [Pseudacidovorax sp.]|nr:D-alanyl-D-alanine carboxypeptidase [Pseudacidovorax sp.]